MTDKPRLRGTSDSLTNMVANLGNQRDKRTHNSFGLSYVSQFELEAAYSSNWLARRIVDEPNKDATREWRTFNGGEAREIAQEEKRLGVQQIVQKAGCWGDLYGGAVILMITDQDLTQPLDPSKIKKGGLKRLAVFDRWDIQPTDFNFSEPLKPNWMLPEYYTIIGGTARIHYTHLIRYTGSMLPRRLSQMQQGWGDSRLSQCMSDLRDVVATKQGIASLVLEANVDTITKDGLSAALAGPECDSITQRYRLFGMMKSIVNLALLDSSEKYERNSVAFAGLSQIMEQFMVWTAGAAQMPVTKVFGDAASGLNSTGEGDLNNYYDAIKTKQTGEMRLQMEQLDQVMVRSAIGEFPEDLEFEWNPLYQSSGLEQAQQTLANAQADDVAVLNGTIKKSHAMKRIQAAGSYDIPDEDIDAQIKLEKEQANGEFEDEGKDLPTLSLGSDDLDQSGANGEAQEQTART